MKNETELLQECKLQLEYLNEKFGETGTTNALLTKLDAVLRQPAVSGRSEQLHLCPVCDEKAGKSYLLSKLPTICQKCDHAWNRA